jgi:transposase-like protein
MTRTLKIYSEAFRREIVAEYEAGEELSTLRKRYGINGMLTIQRWVRRYGKQGLRTEVVHIQKAEEVDRVRELEKQVKELEQALGKMVIEKLKLESILEELQETEGDVVKKNEPPSSNGSSGKSSKGAAK